MHAEPPIYLLSPQPREGVDSLPMISFTQCADAICYEGYDYLLFTSKEAVRTAYTIEPQCKTVPAIAIGEATRKEIEKRGGRVGHVPVNYYAKELAEDIKELFANARILYLRPKTVSYDIKAALAGEGIELGEQVIYETGCVEYVPEDKPEEGSIIIFTSPSTIRCFLDNFGWDASYTAVVIGEATKAHLPEGTRCFVASEPMIDTCVEKALELRVKS